MSKFHKPTLHSWNRLCQKALLNKHLEMMEETMIEQWYWTGTSEQLTKIVIVLSDFYFFILDLHD